MEGKRVAVYWNFNQKNFSVIEKGKKIGSFEFAIMRNPEFRVGQKGSQKVKDTGIKNVHAKIYGTLEKVGNPCHVDNTFPVGYNPKRGTQFVNILDNNPIYNADLVVFDIEGSGLPKNRRKPVVRARNEEV